MSYSSAREYLDSFINYEIHRKPPRRFFKLKRVQKLLTLIGDPHLNFKCLHVAGTKGKGSTCAFVASILQTAGYTVGLYTSPHLSDFKERIRILSPWDCRGQTQAFAGKVSAQALRRSLQEIKPSIERIQARRSLGQLTYFEVLTVLALYYFYKRKADVAVLETGLGGRLDATNVVDSLVSAITPISLEHTEFLGKTIQKIAAEKAGIIKSRSQAVVIAPQDQKALKVIKAQCRKMGASFRVVGKDIMVQNGKTTLQGETFSVRGCLGNYRNLKSRLIGPHQVVNAAVAIGMVESLKQRGFWINRRAIVQGIKNAVWPGRFEVIRHRPLTILDGAHNAASCRVLTDTLRKVLPNKKMVLIFGVSSDKDIKGMAQELAKMARCVIATKANHPRAYEFKAAELENFFPGKEIILSKNVCSALQLAQQKSSADEAIVVTGSLFVVGEARELCLRA